MCTVPLLSKQTQMPSLYPPMPLEIRSVRLLPSPSHCQYIWEPVNLRGSDGEVKGKGRSRCPERPRVITYQQTGLRPRHNSRIQPSRKAIQYPHGVLLDFGRRFFWIRLHSSCNLYIARKFRNVSPHHARPHTPGVNLGYKSCGMTSESKLGTTPSVVVADGSWPEELRYPKRLVIIINYQ